MQITGTIVTYYGDNSRKEVFLNGTEITFDPSGNQVIVYPEETNITKVEIAVGTPELHSIYYDSGWVAHVNITDINSQFGKYIPPQTNVFTEV